MPRTFTALAAAEVNGQDHCHHRHHRHHRRNCQRHHNHRHKVAGESVLMVVGGDNLADNQESSMEIYNRLVMIMMVLMMLMMVVVCCENPNYVEDTRPTRS